MWVKVSLGFPVSPQPAFRQNVVRKLFIVNPDIFRRVTFGVESKDLVRAVLAPGPGLIFSAELISVLIKIPNPRTCLYGAGTSPAGDDQ